MNGILGQGGGLHGSIFGVIVGVSELNVSVVGTLGSDNGSVLGSVFGGGLLGQGGQHGSVLGFLGSGNGSVLGNVFDGGLERRRLDVDGGDGGSEDVGLEH